MEVLQAVSQLLLGLFLLFPSSPLSAAPADVGTESCANAVRCAGAQAAAQSDAAAVACREVPALLRTSEGWERERGEEQQGSRG